MSRDARHSRRTNLLCSPTEALIQARTLMKQGLFHPGRTELPSELSDLGYPGDELMREALCAAFEEAHPKCYQVDPDPQQPPAYIFVWHSTFFGRRIYLLKGTRKKPVLWVYSCHQAYF
ncbi:hypothetical protein SBA4_4050004 [Candidatus Sulfopaludibacter sp. SbA4]|nr:hypothetical protein SBA4_4050004 [Candidatus Sulfopaludibacter sp. SbA4]